MVDSLDRTPGKREKRGKQTIELGRKHLTDQGIERLQLVTQRIIGLLKQISIDDLGQAEFDCFFLISQKKLIRIDNLPGSQQQCRIIDIADALPAQILKDLRKAFPILACNLTILGRSGLPVRQEGGKV
ncbi:hypothetical protein DSECCO2_490130 [anaerobic digester metagenome]